MLKFIFAFDRRGSLCFCISKFFCTFRVDLHANAYQHKTVKMFDLVTPFLLCCDLHSATFYEPIQPLFLSDVHWHVALGRWTHPCHGSKGTKVSCGHPQSTWLFSKTTFLQGPVNLSRACEDAQSLARLTDGWLIGQVSKMIKLTMIILALEERSN